MNRLRMLKARDIIRALKKLGFRKSRQRGSHLWFVSNDGRFTSVPKHAGEDIGRGLLRQILREIQLTQEEFSKYL